MEERRLKLITSHLTTESRITLMSTSAGITADAKAVLETRKSMKVLDSNISYIDTGSGNVVLFLHGNPTAAFLWRDIIPHVKSIARCVAPDLIGMGHSGKPDIQYKFEEHYKYLSTWIDQMTFPGKITLVVHDWGSGLGFHWANQHRDLVQALVYMEALIMPVPSWDGWPDTARSIFQALRSPTGEDMVLKNNMFVERMLPGSIMRTLSDEEMEEYLFPYRDSEKSRLPTLTWPREIPVVTDGPENMVRIATDYYEWLSQSSDLPKLYVDGDPGFFSKGIRILVRDWPNQRTVQVKGLHFLQEDSPCEIGKAIHDFLQVVYKQ